MFSVHRKSALSSPALALKLLHHRSWLSITALFLYNHCRIQHINFSHGLFQTSRAYLRDIQMMPSDWLNYRIALSPIRPAIRRSFIFRGKKSYFFPFPRSPTKKGTDRLDNLYFDTINSSAHKNTHHIH